MKHHAGYGKRGNYSPPNNNDLTAKAQSAKRKDAKADRSSELW
ncbi:hypothetical protein [Kaarinaea lacus]